MEGVQVSTFNAPEIFKMISLLEQSCIQAEIGEVGCIAAKSSSLAETRASSFVFRVVQ